MVKTRMFGALFMKAKAKKPMENVGEADDGCW